MSTPVTDSVTFMLGSPKVERLRELSDGEFCIVDAEVARKLERQRNQLRDALKAIVDLDDGDKPDLWHFEKEFAAGRAALASLEKDSQ